MICSLSKAYVLLFLRASSWLSAWLAWADGPAGGCPGDVGVVGVLLPDFTAPGAPG